MINVLKYLEKEDKCIECKGSGKQESQIFGSCRCALCKCSGKQKTRWVIFSSICEWREKCEKNCDSCQEVPCIESWDLQGSTFEFKLNTNECKDCKDWWDFRGKKKPKEKD